MLAGALEKANKSGHGPWGRAKSAQRSRIPYLFTYRFSRAPGRLLLLSYAASGPVFLLLWRRIVGRVLLKVCPCCWEASEIAATMAKGQRLWSIRIAYKSWNKFTKLDCLIHLGLVRFINNERTNEQQKDKFRTENSTYILQHKQSCEIWRVVLPFGQAQVVVLEI